ncbi:MAG: NAD(P)/FAD-dependent oxidoreductase [Lachnospiraceae bacterium]|nr:NAD(P)/FAD-dependent oxidoreductase [Lachnospiraceae bacterium]
MKIVVIGGGAAGMMAALTAAENGAGVTLLEKNEKLGKKIYITGKGRCNFTNACPPEDFLKSVVRNPRFMYSSFSAFNNEDTARFFEKNGLRTKTERGARVFPESDKASDVTRTLEKALRGAGAEIILNAKVLSLHKAEDGIFVLEYLRNEKKTLIRCDRVIVATGGLSYSSTGSDGDGYRFAIENGHGITDRYPSLVSVRASLPDGESLAPMAGLSPKNVSLSLLDGGRRVFEEFGEMLFTHDGISGPIVLTLSALLEEKYLKNNFELFKKTYLLLDWKPALSPEQLDKRLLREFDSSRNKTLRNVMRSLLPESTVPAVLLQARVSPGTPVHEVTREQRRGIADALKKFRLIPVGLGGYNEAVITRGGVNVRQINPSTMESKVTAGLYFAGEVLDIDALTGGFNLQLAWTTGHAAGRGAAGE